MDITRLRQEYSQPSIDVEQMNACPILQFESWFRVANESPVIIEPNAMILATVDAKGRPTQRTVLLKLFDNSGFVFFTNGLSRKAQQIAGNPNVALLFPWYGLQRQVEVNGVSERVTVTESLKYFALRPRGSQLGAWASRQSSVAPTRALLKSKLSEMAHKFASGEVPMPPTWGGFRVVPTRIEFWQGGQDRLHDRLEYSLITGDLASNDKKWQLQRLAP